MFIFSIYHVSVWFWLFEILTLHYFSLWKIVVHNTYFLVRNGKYIKQIIDWNFSLNNVWTTTISEVSCWKLLEWKLCGRFWAENDVLVLCVGIGTLKWCTLAQLDFLLGIWINHHSRILTPLQIDSSSWAQKYSTTHHSLSAKAFPQ